MNETLIKQRPSFDEWKAIYKSLPEEKRHQLDKLVARFKEAALAKPK